MILGGLSLLEEVFRKIEEFNKANGTKMSIADFLVELVGRGGK